MDRFVRLARLHVRMSSHIRIARTGSRKLSAVFLVLELSDVLGPRQQCAGSRVLRIVDAQLFNVLRILRGIRVSGTVNTERVTEERVPCMEIYWW
jgi:hypothetical protein